MKIPSLDTISIHRPPMRLVDELLESDAASTALAKTIIKENAPYFLNGEFETSWLIEIMAQAVSLLGGHELWTSGDKNKIGYLITVDSYNFVPCDESLNIQPGDELRTEVNVISKMLPIACYQGKIYKSGREICNAKMKVFGADSIE